MNKISEKQAELITTFIRFSAIWMRQRKQPLKDRKGIQKFRRILGNIREAGEYDNVQRRFLSESRNWFLKEFKNQTGDSYKNYLKECKR